MFATRTLGLGSAVALALCASVSVSLAAPLVSLDLVQGEWESVQLPALPAGAKVQASLALTVPSGEAGNLPVEQFELLWQDEQGWLLPAEQYARPADDAAAWLVIRELRAPPGTYRGEVQVKLGDEAETLCELELRVWNLELPPRGNFLYKPWYDVTVWGSRDADPEQQERVLAFAEHLGSLRANVAEQGMPFNDYVTRARLKDTGEPASALAGRADLLAHDPLPKLDFSRYDPWYQALLAQGFSRVDIHQGNLKDARLKAGIKFVTGQEYEYGTPEWERYYTWLLGEFQEYLLALGFQEVWIKLMDEIGILTVDEWLEQAALLKRHGFRIWTTITDYVARRADAVTRMNPLCDGWVVQVMLFNEFHDLVSNKWVRSQGRGRLDEQWTPYTTSDAEATFAQKFFDLPERPEWRYVESLGVFEGETELRQVKSPWGNKERGVFANRGPFIYLSPTDGSDPRENGRAYSIQYRCRQRDEQGETIASIDAEDQLLYYQSLGRKLGYEEMRRLAWLALARGLEGYGTWTYYWWKEEARSVEWRDGRVISSPAVEGIRDGNEDAALYVALRERIAGLEDAAARQAAQARLDALIGEGDEVILQMEERVYTRYVAAPVWRDVKMESADQFRRAKRVVLEVLDALGA